jgi:hypothetical protein
MVCCLVKSEQSVNSSIYDAEGGETNLPRNKTIFCWLSRMKKRNGRSALNSTGGDSIFIAEQRLMMTAVAAAASDPK